MKTNYKLVVFDFDGTLADSFSAFLWTMDQAAERHGFRTIDRSKLEELRGYGVRQMAKHLGIPLRKMPAIVSDMRRLMLERVGEVRLFDGMAGVLRALAEAGVAVAVVTSNSEVTVRQVLAEETVAHVAHFECGVSIFGKGAKLKRLLRHSGCAAREVLCIGDEIRDHEAAKAARMDFVGVAWGYTSPVVLRRYSDAPLFRTAAEIVQSLVIRSSQ